MSSPHETSRRDFLKETVGVTLALSSAPYLVRADEPAETAEPPAEAPKPVYKDVRVAFIGVGGIGGFHLENADELKVQCPCFCDVDTRQFARGFKQYPRARAYQDYRALFDNEHKNFDAVMIGTPDHHHYPATIIAMQLGKHVYTQKPLTHTVWEARQLTEAAKRYKVCTQMGNQGHALEGWRLVYEWIRGGALGDIKEVHTWTDRPIWPQGVDRPEGQDEVPPGFNWDVWIGPAPMRPFKKETYHPFSWRGWWDFGCGALGDMACHTMDGSFWALEPGSPTAIEPLALTPMNGDSFPKASIVRWEFPAREISQPAINGTAASVWKRPAFVQYWYDGGLRPAFPPDLEAGRSLTQSGNLFIGTKASMLVQGDYGNSPRIIPESKMKEIGRPQKMLDRSPGHVREWVMAIAGEKPATFPGANFGYAGPFSEAILLGNIALRVGRRIEWDGPNLKVTNIPEANQFVTKEYREGWRF